MDAILNRVSGARLQEADRTRASDFAPRGRCGGATGVVHGCDGGAVALDSAGMSDAWNHQPALATVAPPGTPLSDKSRAVAVALGFITGIFGGHRYYVGKVGTGLLMTFTFGGFGIWWLVDMIMLLSGEFRDANGRLVRQWSTELMPPGAVTGEQLEAIHAELDRLRHELMDVHERIDFQERLLQKGRER